MKKRFQIVTHAPRTRALATLAVFVLTVPLGRTSGPAEAAGLNDDGLRFEITSGPRAGEYPAVEPSWTVPVWSQSSGEVRGPTIFGGYGCLGEEDDIAAPSALGPLAEGEQTIVVFQRGPTNDPNNTGAACTLNQKIDSGQSAGYDVVLIANHHGGAEGGAKPDEPYCGHSGGTFNPTVVGACIGHRVFHHLFGTTPDYSVPYPVGDPSGLEPDPGVLGERISIASMGLPMLASRAVLGNGWSTYAVLTPGGTVEFPLRLDSEVSPGQIGAWLYSAGDEFMGGVAFGSQGSEISYFGSVKIPGYELTVGEAVQRGRSTISMTANVTTTGPAIFKVLLWGAARKSVSWQNAARGPEGAKLLGADHGSSSFLALAREFNAPVNAEAHVTAGGRATVLGEYRFQVKDTLISSWAAPYNTNLGAHGHLTSVSTPRGERYCGVYSCGFTDFTGPARAAPGEYVFRLSGAGVGLAGSDDISLTGIDARLPAVSSAVGALDAVGEGDDLVVTGWAGFTGAPLDLVGTDPSGDTTTSLPSESGYDLTSAFVGQPDADTGDLRFELGLAGSPQPFGTPAARYLWDFGVRTPDGTKIFQIDGKLSDESPLSVSTSGGVSVSLEIPVFILRGNCTGPSGAMSCEKVADLAAWMDGHQDTVAITVPRIVLERELGASLEGGEIVAAKALDGIVSARWLAGASEEIEDRLEPARDPYHTAVSRRVEIGLVAAGDQPSFTVGAELSGQGTFATSLDASELAPGAYDLYARACFGEMCGQTRLKQISI